MSDLDRAREQAVAADVAHLRADGRRCRCLQAGRVVTSTPLTVRIEGLVVPIGPRPSGNPPPAGARVVVGLVGSEYAVLTRLAD